MFVDFYAILDIPFNADLSIVKSAYRTQSKKWHPDVNRGKDTTEQMQLINQANLILGDTEAKEKYDLEFIRFKKVCNDHQNFTHEPFTTYKNYEPQDELLSKWMAKAKQQAVEISKQAIKDFKGVSVAAAKGASKGVTTQLLGVIIAVVLGAIIRGCSQ